MNQRTRRGLLEDGGHSGRNRVWVLSSTRTAVVIVCPWWRRTVKKTLPATANKVNRLTLGLGGPCGNISELENQRVV